ncbi:MAG: ANTAR domain-containing protein [Myxococcales bacterium]
MAEADTQSRLRVLIVDEEEAVRDILSMELSAAGYEVDTLSSGNGFSEDMVALIRPDLLLVNPFLTDVPLEAVERVLVALHGDGSFKLVLIDGGEDPGKLSGLAVACRADGSISKRELLRAPADAVAEQFLPEAEVMEVLGDELPPSAEVAAESGLDIELTVEPPRRRPPARAAASQPAIRRPASSAVRASASGRVLDMIQSEVGKVPKAPPKVVTDYRIEINLFSRHNFYVGATGDLRTGGVFVATAVLPAVGERLRLVLQLPFAAPLEVEAPVEWIREGNQLSRVTPGAGLSLAHLPAEWRAHLEIFFRERAPLTYLPKR